jgi:hypothetical protein
MDYPKVICIDSFRSIGLTRGRQYDMISTNGETYTILDDTLTWRPYMIWRFCDSEKEWRNIRLKEIME